MGQGKAKRGSNQAMIRRSAESHQGHSVLRKEFRMNDLDPMWTDGALRRRDLAWANANSCAASGLAELAPPTCRDLCVIPVAISFLHILRATQRLPLRYTLSRISYCSSIPEGRAPSRPRRIDRKVLETGIRGSPQASPRRELIDPERVIDSLDSLLLFSFPGHGSSRGFALPSRNGIGRAMRSAEPEARILYPGSYKHAT